MQTEMIPVVAVVGPTASGKTELAIQLAKRFDGEVVSADSMQIYRGLPISTAQPSREEMDGVPHHLLAFLDWDKPFSVADYVTLAGQVIREIRARGRLPIVVGGTGLYVSSLLHHISFSEEPRDNKLRAELEQRVQREGADVLLEELRGLDPETAARLCPRDIKRIVRALELCRLTGKTMASLREESRREPSPYQACWIGLTYADRSLLYDRINRRVGVMLENGLLDEARRLMEFPGAATVKQAIGCKEFFPCFRGECTLEEAADRLRQGTRRYAKRQLTWFRREEAIHWIERDRVSDDRVLQEVSSIVAKELSIRYNEEEPDSGVPKKNSENQAAEREREV